MLFTLPEDQLPTVAQHMTRSTLEVDAYSRDSQTKITYACNSFDADKVVKNLDNYVPRAVYVDLP